ncbi:uncharacterized protein KY384_001897 [Bacidia gigantensis]|uniref:uncharacterized protein n=1 Tax=Bacidia gigantensis TaxID=2732470 RepID=UPI001D03B7D9|nr:uncharacterized protein KY384_001897 [Bacidia gigantensis]KAG8533114.1 hypothetical protein KY384_001897 [Bacidia gigantensis]
MPDLRDPSTTPLNFTKSINLALSERGINAMRSAGHPALLHRIFEDAIPMKARMIHGRTDAGDLFQESQQYDANGRSIRAVDRTGLNKCLLDALDERPNVTLHFNHKLTGADFDNNVAWFEQLKPQGKSNELWHGSENGRRPNEIEVRFDFFIGADGAHSATRFHMMKFARLSYQQEYIDTLWCEFHIKPTSNDGFAIDPNHLHIWPAGSFMFIAIPSSDHSFTCTLFASAEHFQSILGDPKANLSSFFNAHFPGVCPDLISETDLLDQFQNNPHLPLISIKCSPHHYSSSVVILGDSAHAMVPFYGQGMNAGLEDVRVLFSHLDFYGLYLSEANTKEMWATVLEKALDAYTAQRVRDAHTINDLALRNYQEMSANVRSPLYKLRKSLEETVSVWMPWTGLGVEKVSDRHKTSVEDSPNDIKPPRKIVNGAWRNIDNHKIAEPMAADAERNALVASAERHDLRGVHPGDGQNTPGEDVEEDEAEGYEYPLRGARVDVQHYANHDHAEGAGGGGRHEDLPAPDFFNEEVRTVNIIRTWMLEFHYLG